MDDADKLVVLERHLRDVGLKMSVGLKEDAIPEMSKRLLYSKNYVFSLTTGALIPEFANAELIEQSLSPSCREFFKQHKDDTTPAPQPSGKPQKYGMDADEFDKLPGDKRLALINAQDTRIAMETAAAERAEIDAAVKAALPPQYDQLSLDARYQIAHQTEAKIVAARKRAES